MDEIQLRFELKELIVTELNLQGRDPAAIDDDALLFGPPPPSATCLGLDSLDALQLAMSIEEKYAVRIPEGDEAPPIFRSIRTLAAYVMTAGPRGAPAEPASRAG
jgi:acyl carrier protein